MRRDRAQSRTRDLFLLGPGDSTPTVKDQLKGLDLRRLSPVVHKSFPGHGRVHNSSFLSIFMMKMPIIVYLYPRGDDMDSTDEYPSSDRWCANELPFRHRTEKLSFGRKKRSKMLHQRFPMQVPNDIGDNDDGDDVDDDIEERTNACSAAAQSVSWNGPSTPQFLL